MYPSLPLGFACLVSNVNDFMNFCLIIQEYKYDEFHLLLIYELTIFLRCLTWRSLCSYTCMAQMMKPSLACQSGGASNSNKNTGYSVTFEIQVTSEFFFFFYHKHVSCNMWDMLTLKRYFLLNWNWNWTGVCPIFLWQLYA